MVKVAVIELADTTVTLLTATPVPLTVTLVDPGAVARFEPEMVTEIVESLVAFAGVIAVRWGAGVGGTAAVIVIWSSLLTPRSFATVTACAPGTASGEIVNFALKLPSLL